MESFAQMRLIQSVVLLGSLQDTLTRVQRTPLERCGLDRIDNMRNDAQEGFWEGRCVRDD